MRRLLFLVALAGLAFAYTDSALEINAAVDTNGNAHVIEKSIFTLDNPEEVQTFEHYLLQGSTLPSDWKRFSNNIKYHFGRGSEGGVSNLRIIAAREFGYGYTAASVSMEYDFSNLFLREKVNERVVRYVLDNRQLSFGSSDELKLNSGQSLSMLLPTGALNVVVAPAGGAVRDRYNEIAWTGPLVGRWDVSFETEKSLSQEVTEFFMDAYKSASESYLWLVVLAFLAVAAFKYLKLRE